MPRSLGEDALIKDAARHLSDRSSGNPLHSWEFDSWQLAPNWRLTYDAEVKHLHLCSSGRQVLSDRGSRLPCLR
jgi:hypothetical protein